MAFDLENLDIVNNPDEKRFEAELEPGKFAIVEYMMAGKNIIFSHTEVPIGYEGQGIASKMSKHALDYAKDNGLKVQALCPYVAAYVRRHPEYQSITWGY